MITAVDSNVLIDILEPDPTYGLASKEALKSCLNQGSVVACEVVWAEVATAYAQDIGKLVQALDSMGIVYSAMSKEASLEAARRWYEYRKRGGTRKRIVDRFDEALHSHRHCNNEHTKYNSSNILVFLCIFSGPPCSEILCFVERRNVSRMKCIEDKAWSMKKANLQN